MAQSLGHGQIGIVELDILSNQAHGNGFIPGGDLVKHPFPVGQVDIGGIDVEFPADQGGKMLLLQHHGGLIQGGQGAVFNDAVLFHIAKQGDLLENALFQRLVAPQHDHIRLDPQALELFHGVLGGLGLVFVGAPEERHQGHMDEEAVLPAHLQGNLPHRLYKGLGFNVSDGAADLRDHHVRLGLLAHPVDELLDLVGDMGDDLDSGAQVCPLPLLVQHIPVDLAGGQVGVFVQILVNEPLVVAQIQIRLRPVLGDVDLPVLIGAHGARVYVDIGV